MVLLLPKALCPPQSDRTPWAFSPLIILTHGFAIFMLYAIIRGILSFSTLRHEMAFYGTFHRDPFNQVIHILDYPLIVSSLFIIFAHLSIPSIPSGTNIHMPFIKNHQFNYATIATSLYLVFYLYLDFFGGVLYAPLLYFLYAVANNLTAKDQKRAWKEAKEAKGHNDPTGKNVREKISWTGTGKLLKLAAIAQLFGWCMLLFAHVVVEGALEPSRGVEGISRSLTSAPFFSFYDVLWFIGFNKELQYETKALVDQYTIEFCKDGLEMRACSDYDFN